MTSVASWKIIVAFIIDLLVLIIMAVLISFLTGGVASESIDDGIRFNAHLGWTGFLIWIAAIVAYYKLMRRYCGGTVGKKIVGI